MARFAVAEPADARGKSLEVDSLLGQFDPAAEARVFGEEFEDQLIGPVDVLRIAGERDPAEWAFALAEERTDVFRYEAGDVKGVFDASQLCLRAQVVAVVEGDGAEALQFQHGLDVLAHGSHRAARVLFRVALAEFDRFGQRHAVGDVAVQRIVGAGLVGQHIGDDVAADEFRQHIGGVADQADGDGFASRFAASRMVSASSRVHAMWSQ